MNPIVLTATPWQLRPVDRFNQGLYPLTDEGWFEQDLPAHWQQCRPLRYHTGKVVYRHRFNHQPAHDNTSARRYWLRANGLFFWSHIYLNGRDFGRHEGYFVPQEHEVTGMLSNSNTLIIEVDCPEERRKSGKRMLTGVFSHWDALDPMANPGGVWLPIELAESGVAHIQGAQLYTERIDADAAQLYWQVDIDSLAAVDLELHWTLEPSNFEGESFSVHETKRLHGGVERLRGTFALPNPQLWWTHDLGQPNLYRVTLEISCLGTVSDRSTFRFGIRTFEFRDFIPHLNGTRFLIKGNNYPPTDTRIATATTERLQQDLELARNCHMNFMTRLMRWVFCCGKTSQCSGHIAGRLLRWLGNKWLKCCGCLVIILRLQFGACITSQSSLPTRRMSAF
jgi:beta-mannosidase